MIYHHIALNIPLGLMTYSHDQAIAVGTRVVVTFAKRKMMGVVWASDISPDYDENKILPVQSVLEDGWCFAPDFLKLIDFCSRYYHYPIGQTLFTALPQGLKETQAQPFPPLPLVYTLNEWGRQHHPPPKHQSKKWALWQTLQQGAHSLEKLKHITPSAPKYLSEWQAWLDIVSPASATHIAPTPHTLNPQQQHAIDEICQKFNQFHVFTLYGITGSGKTEVYFEAITQALQQNQQVLFLLPEINLTPQLLARIQQRFPHIALAVLHSQTASGQRTRDYLRAMQGTARLVIGTRLAVFTPLPQLGLVIVDEEHDSSFKQDNELRYHARDLAIYRAQQAQIPIVLGSATPSLETWHKAQNQQYQLLQLTQRAHQQAQIPNIQILDTRYQPLENGFSPQALTLLQHNFKRGGLSLVYLNRRGYAPALFCPDCGHLFSCPHCSAKLVLHQRTQQLRCHHCDERQSIPSTCPNCGNHDLTAIGHGTQRVEQTLQRHLPQAKIVRVDRDSTSNKNDWQHLYQQIHNQEIDILVGTQMLAKGHDFARLNLVIVVNADGSLYSADFRACERLFTELMQVSGRAGRAQYSGRVLIQTQLPEHPLLHAVQAQDYPQFANQELNDRQAFNLPPFIFQASIRADAPDLASALNFLNKIRDTLAPILPESTTQMGAVPALMQKIAGRERAQIFLESPNRTHLHRAISLWQQVLYQYPNHKIRWSIDVDPQEI